jgi:hypothetical protein
MIAMARAHVLRGQESGSLAQAGVASRSSPTAEPRAGGVNEGDAGQIDGESTGWSHLGQGLAELADGEGLDLPLRLAGNGIVSAGFSIYGEHFGAPLFFQTA